jgi:L-histidine N-alpha-methyltransferase
MASSLTLDRYSDHAAWLVRLRRDALVGLSAHPRSLPPKYFYDERGSELFERITHLPEYYLTRAEWRILERIAEPLFRRLHPHELVEIGSGASRKTRLLLEAMHRNGGDRYVAFDVSEDALRGAAEALRASYPWLFVHGVVGDFDHDLPRVPRGPRRLVAFLGSTMGNLDRPARARFLEHVRGLLQADDRFLLGVDLVKDPAVIEAAYNDSQGVTAEFNRNVLHVLNRELDADFPVDDFEHVSVWSPEGERIETGLRAGRACTVRVAALDLELDFAAGELLATEISCKFTRASIEGSLAAAGLHLEEWHTDSRGAFALAVAAPDA